PSSACSTVARSRSMRVTKAMRGRASSSHQAHTFSASTFVSPPVGPRTSTAPVAARRQLRVSCRKAEQPGVSIRLSSCLRHPAWCSVAVIELLRRTSSGSTSTAEEPSSTRPSRLVAPEARRSASATVVFPAPPCPTMATFLNLATSSADIPSSVALVDDAEPVEGQELVHGLDGGGHRGDERGEAPGGEGAGPGVVLPADALDQPVHQRGVAVGHA